MDGWMDGLLIIIIIIIIIKAKDELPYNTSLLHFIIVPVLSSDQD